MDHEILVNEDGSLSAIYSDDLVEIFALGQTRIRRASNVEPYPGGGWFVDLSPVGGPTLFNIEEEPDWFPNEGDRQWWREQNEHRPFETRKAALEAEVAWLKAQMAQRRLEVK